MKKALLLVAVLAIGGAAFAQNKTKGLDIHIGIPYSLTTLRQENDLGENVVVNTDIGWEEINFQFKLATYNGIWVNNHIGLYGSIGVSVGSMLSPGYMITSYEGKEIARADLTFNEGSCVSGDFMFGPAFGVDMGRVRFQSGVALHVNVATCWAGGSRGTEWAEQTATLEVHDTLTSASLGFALTPQFRFTANNRCSFLIGTDFIFDFPVYANRYREGKVKINDRTVQEASGDQEFDIKSSFRFAFTPYLGLGINF